MIFYAFGIVIIASIYPGLVAAEKNLEKKEVAFSLEQTLDSIDQHDCGEMESKTLEHIVA
ncbi:hypothetical protein H0X06_06885, partial [Candidatus Dependentiae bacterium]|nr:hypothetical protein [Candidatus Dependentiae bacterium]